MENHAVESVTQDKLMALEAIAQAWSPNAVGRDLDAVEESQRVEEAAAIGVRCPVAPALHPCGMLSRY